MANRYFCKASGSWKSNLNAKEPEDDEIQVLYQSSENEKKTPQKKKKFGRDDKTQHRHRHGHGSKQKEAMKSSKTSKIAPEASTSEIDSDEPVFISSPTKTKSRTQTTPVKKTYLDFLNTSSSKSSPRSASSSPLRSPSSSQSAFMPKPSLINFGLNKGKVTDEDDDDDELLDLEDPIPSFSCLAEKFSPSPPKSAVPLAKTKSTTTIGTSLNLCINMPKSKPSTTSHCHDHIQSSSQRSQLQEGSRHSSGSRSHSEKSSQSQSQSSETSKKHKHKEESANKREDKRLEKEQKEKQLAMVKELKKSENELRKNAKPGEAHKFITILIDKNLPILTELVLVLDAAEVKHETNPNALVQNAFIFRREQIFRAMGDDLNLHKVSKLQEENQIMVFLDQEEIVPKIAVTISKNDSVPDYEDEVDFIIFIKSIQESLPGKKITLFLFGMESYFKKLKTKTQQEFRQRVMNGDKEKKSRKKKAELPVISRLGFQSTLVQLQLETNINFREVNNVNELGMMLVQYTKAIAEAPFKQLRKEQGFDWYAAADTAGSVKVEKDGKGLARLWLEQLQMFNGVGIDTAQSISAVYPSPKHLIKAYARCDTQEDGERLICDLKVRMGVGPLAKMRKVGPELSKKLYRFFTSSDGERNLQSSQNI